MLPQKSLRTEFALKLLPIFAALTFGFSYLVYAMIESEMFSQIEHEMAQEAAGGADRSALNFTRIDEGEKVYLRLESFDKQGERKEQFERDVTSQARLLADIKRVVITANFISLVLIPLIAGLYSFFLAHPIGVLTEELSKMDENSIAPIASKIAPIELLPLTKALNSLLERLKSHIAYQRELFSGVAHELKTPLAVIRAKNDVTLLKERSTAKYQEVLHDTNRVIGEINTMTKTVLELGRAEYAQFDPKTNFDITEFLRAKTGDYEILAHKEKRGFVADIKPDALLIRSRPALFEHIVQNLFGNALKATPAGNAIEFRSCLEDSTFTIEVIDEGGGLPPEAKGVDLFAPFVSKGAGRGTGLGLYLAKNAAIALNGSLSLENRADKRGAVARFTILDIKPIKV